MASMHAYKTVFALKKIAKDILYSPEDILTNEATSDEIVKDGFNILDQNRCDRGGYPRDRTAGL